MPDDPQVSSLKDLILQWEVCKTCLPQFAQFCGVCQGKPRTFRLLAEWLRAGRMKRGWIDDLPEPIAKCYRRPWEELPEFPAEARSLIPAPESENSFTEWLILAWCIRQVDHSNALTKPRIRRELKELMNQGADREQLLDLTYVPRSIIELVPKMRKGMKSVRENDEQRRMLQAHKQKIAKGIKSSFSGEQVLSKDQEQFWAARFAFDKKTDDLSRQTLWTWIFVPLATYLHQYVVGRKLESWKKDMPPISDKAFEQASTLIHCRYPDLWNDREWRRVKARCRNYLIP